jgi:hypothetical protein
MSYDELRKPVSSSPAREIENTGKIYYNSPYLLVNEVNKGIHVIDNSDPTSPKPVSFINLPGNLDIAMKDGILYADSYIDLVALDVSDPLNVREVWRDQNVFEQRTYNGWSGDATLGVITEWLESDTTIEQDCTNPTAWFLFDFGFATNTGQSSGGSSSTTSPGIGIAGSLARFAVTQDFLYCLNNFSLNLYDVTNASLPSNRGSILTGWGVETIFPYENKLFIGMQTGVSIYDNTNPTAPSLLSTVTHVTGCDPVVVQGDYAYSTIHAGNFCGQNFNELNVINISDPLSPSIQKTYLLNKPYGLGIEGNHLFVCDDVSGLKWYDAADPVNLTLKKEIKAGATRDVILNSGWMLLVSDNGLYQFNYTDTEITQLSFLPAGGK